MEPIINLLDKFLAWGTEPNILPYIPALLIVALGFAGMWAKAHWATIPHELGHAFVALLLGKKLNGININRDSSGDTHTSEYVSKNPVTQLFTMPLRWVRNILVSFAGYPAPFALAWVMMFFLARDQSRLSLVILFVLLVFTFLYSTNWFGFFMVVGGLLITGLALWLESPLLREVLILFLGGGMISGGVKGIVEAWQVYVQDTKTSAERWFDPTFDPQHSDARALSRRTLIPQIVWLVVFSLLGVFMFAVTMAEFVTAYR